MTIPILNGADVLVLKALDEWRAETPETAVLVADLQLPKRGWAGTIASLEERGLISKVAKMNRRNWAPNRWWLTELGGLALERHHAEAMAVTA